MYKYFRDLSVSYKELPGDIRTKPRHLPALSKAEEEKLYRRTYPKDDTPSEPAVYENPFEVLYKSVIR